MLKPVEWNAALAENKHWKEAYPVVEREARALLSTFLPGEWTSTNELVEELYPANSTRGDGVKARKRIFKALMALAERGLSDCARKGTPRPRKGTKHAMIEPWEWSKPEPKIPVTVKPAAGGGFSTWAVEVVDKPPVQVCPHCGEDIF